MVHLVKIRELCDRNNVTIKQAASDLGMTEQSLHKIIKGNSTKIDTLISISEYFKVDPAYFFDSRSNDIADRVNISQEDFNDLIKKIIAYSINGFGLIKLEWDSNEGKFNTYFDILKKQYSPDENDLKYISSLLKTKIEITDKTTPKDISKLLMTKDEFDFTSTYYYGIKKMEIQEELQRLMSFIDKHSVSVTESMNKEISDLKDQIKYYESKSIIGTNK